MGGAALAHTARRRNFELERLARPILLDQTIYRDVARDPYATAESAAVVFASGALFALGHLGLGLQMVAAQFLAAIVLWLIGLGITFYLGTEVAGGLHDSTLLRTFRVLAFASVPRALVLLLVLPGVGIWFAAAAMALTVAAYTQAIQQLFDLDLRVSAQIALAANLTPLIGFVVVLLILA